MDGVHDLGGLDGFGPVTAPPSEPVFAEDWERRALRVMMATIIGLDPGGARFRHSIERMDPGHYLTSSYYEHWLTGVSTLLVEAGKTSSEELDRRAGRGGPHRAAVLTRRSCPCAQVASRGPHPRPPLRPGPAGRGSATGRSGKPAGLRGARRTAGPRPDLLRAVH